MKLSFTNTFDFDRPTWYQDEHCGRLFRNQNIVPYRKEAEEEACLSRNHRHRDTETVSHESNDQHCKWDPPDIAVHELQLTQITQVREFGWPGERYVMMKFKGASFKDTYRRKCNELLRHISAEHIHNFERLHVTLGQASTDVDPAVYYDYFKTTVFPILQQLVKKHKEPFSFRTGNSEDRGNIPVTCICLYILMLFFLRTNHLPG